MSCVTEVIYIYYGNVRLGVSHKREGEQLGGGVPSAEVNHPSATGSGCSREEMGSAPVGIGPRCAFLASSRRLDASKARDARRAAKDASGLQVRTMTPPTFKL